MTLAAWLVASYLAGAIPTSYLVARYVAKVDLRKTGSGNLGATNLYRSLGWKYAVPVALFDMAKGAVPVLVFAPRAGGAAWTPVLLGAVAMVGHVYSVFVSFRGGKGVATAAGVVLALAPVPTAISAATWAVLVKLTGYVSVGSMIGAAVFPLAAWLLPPHQTYTIAAGVVLAGFIVFNHRANIERLLQGTESRFGRSRMPR